MITDAGVLTDDRKAISEGKMLICTDTESESKLTPSMSESLAKYIVPAWKGAWTSCDEVVLTFLKGLLLAYCLCLNSLRSGLLLLTATALVM